ncbi:MAG: complement resistance protein TraT [Desulfovibrio sp.]|nr:complement resistance protein TraT [Desulfovibrio sp.]
MARIFLKIRAERSNIFNGKPLYCLFALSLLTAACIPHGRDAASGLMVLRNGVLTLPQSEDIARVAYVSVTDADNRISGLRVKLENCLTSKGFTVTGNPSEAGYIIQLSVPAAGPGSREAAHAAVREGYAGEARLSGTDGTVLVADTLVVQRRVPKSGKKRLKTISNRMTVADDQMRLGLFVPRKISFQPEFPEYVTERTAGEICSGLNAASSVSP